MSDKPERVFISVDMEGISGIVDWAQVGGDQKEYEVGRRLMAGDLNAAVEGALEAGAEEIVVSDAHGRKRNLQPEEVHEAAYLIRGSPKPGSMMEGISDRFDAALYVGYHSMKGTEKGILCHTISGGGAVDAVFINGRETGEFGMNAALASWHGVPSVLISGDAAVAAEARSLVPNIRAAVVKWGGRQVRSQVPKPEEGEGPHQEGRDRGAGEHRQHRALQGRRARGGQAKIRDLGDGGPRCHPPLCRARRR